MRKAICLIGDDTQGGVGKAGTIMQITTRRSSVGIPHLFCPMEEGSNPGGVEIHRTSRKPLYARERERESGAQWEEGQREGEREREREGRRERERERGGERPTEQESGANRHYGRVVGSS